MDELLVIGKKEFSRTLFGYNKLEVALYLEDLEKNFGDFKEKATLLKTYNQQLEQNIQDELIKSMNIEKELNLQKDKCKELSETLFNAQAEIRQLKKQIAILKNEEVAEDFTSTSSATDTMPDLKNAFNEAPPVYSTTNVSSLTDSSDEDVYEGEIELKVDKSSLIGTEDDEDAGFSFLDDTEDDDVFVGEIEEKVNKSNLIGSEDDDDAGFNFL